MTNKRPELILSLRNLSGEARKIISAHVQDRLFNLGYSWTGPKLIQHTSHDALCVFSPLWNRLNITFADGAFETRESAIFFDASQVAEFLTKAEEFSTHTTNIHGVDVTVRGDEITLDPSHLLKHVAEHAKSVQSELFNS